MCDSNYLLVAAGVLIALLSLWAQLWVNFGSNKRSNEFTASIGLFWIYLSIVIAMVSLGILFVERFWDSLACSGAPIISGNCHVILRKIAFGFLVTSFLMGLANMIESAFSICWKAWRGKTAFDSLKFMDPWSTNIKGIIKHAFLAAILLLIFSVIGSVCNPWVYLGDLAVFICAFFYLKKKFVARLKMPHKQEDKEKIEIDKDQLQ